MANPQIENGYLRIANEIWDEIIRRDFSKRQLAILHLILRLSYGCKRKEANIPRLKDFEICGVGRTHISKELNYLEQCRVITWDKDSMLFKPNKDYEKWQVNPVKGWDEEEYKSLIHLNLTKKSYQNGNFEVTKTVTSQEGGYQNSNQKVTETVTSELPKQEPQGALNPYVPTVEEGSKDNIKDSVKDSNNIVVDKEGSENHNLPNEEGRPCPRQDSVSATPELSADLSQSEISELDLNYRESIATTYINKRNQMDPSRANFELMPHDVQAINELIAKQVPLDIVLQGIDHTFTHYKPSRPGQAIKSLKYCLNKIYDLHFVAKKKETDHRQASFEIHREPEPSSATSDSSYNPDEDEELQELLNQMKI